MREHGAKLVCQLHTTKPQAGRGAVTETSIDMSKDEIKAVIQNYVQYLMAEKILQEGKADMIAMARAFMAEPHL